VAEDLPLESPSSAGSSWTFLTNHGHVLLCISRCPEVRLRDVAEDVGITERAAQRIVADLVNEGYLTRVRVGRRNQYQVHTERHLRHPVEEKAQIAALLNLVASLE
jgi:DNA-binding MarR family transcriptional regulator